jgi:hypothetical protein
MLYSIIQFFMLSDHKNTGFVMRLKADITLFIIWGSAFVTQRVAGQLGSVYPFNGARRILAGLVALPLLRHL